MPVATGTLGGTPVVPQRPTQYKVTAESRFSTVTSTLTIEVMPKARAEEAKANEELDVIEMIMVRRTHPRLRDPRTEKSTPLGLQLEGSHSKLALPGRVC